MIFRASSFMFMMMVLIFRIDINAHTDSIYRMDPSQWIGSLGNNLSITQDSNEGKFYITQAKSFWNMKGAVYQVFHLPENSNKIMDISLTCKPTNLSSCYLKARCYDRTETLIHTDSSTVRLQEGWQQIRLHVPAEGVRFVQVIIDVTGIEDSNVAFGSNGDINRSKTAS
jgi:hypothetical protein